MANEYRDLSDKEQAILKLPVYFDSYDNYYHPIREVSTNARDVLINNKEGKIEVILHDDNQTITVKDNGCGIPLDGESNGKPNWQHAFLILFSGSKMSSGGTSGGTNGCGNTIINYTSDYMEITSKRNGKIYNIAFENGGEILKPFSCLGNTDKHGTEITFKLCNKIYTNTVFDSEEVKGIIERIVVTSRNITSYFIYKDNTTTFHFDSLNDYITYKDVHRTVGDINFNKKEYQTEYFDIDRQNNALETTGIKLVINSSNDNNIHYGFLNGIYLPKLGTIHTGILEGLKDCFNSYMKINKMYKDKESAITKEDIEETITYVCDVESTNVVYSSQTKFSTDKDLYKVLIKQYIKEFMEFYTIENNDNVEALANKILINKHSRERAEEAKKGKKQTKKNNKKPLPDKVTDWCTFPRNLCEIYVVEGDSAGGSAKQGADKRFQAIMPTKGKILNVEKQKTARVIASETLEIFNDAIGIDLNTTYKEKNLNYGKIIIMSDADVDGMHIRNLWMTYIYRYHKELIENGYLYIAQPPLFKVEKNKIIKYIYSDEELSEYLEEIGGKDNSTDIQRYKGLGEMNAVQLWDTTMNPETRQLLQVTIEDATLANEVTSLLMGDIVEPRQEFIINNSTIATLDI